MEFLKDKRDFSRKNLEKRKYSISKLYFDFANPVQL